MCDGLWALHLGGTGPSWLLRRHRHEEVAADPDPQVPHPIQKLRQVGMEPGGKDLVDAAVLQVALDASGAAQGFGALRVGHVVQVGHHLVHAGGQ